MMFFYKKTMFIACMLTNVLIVTAKDSGKHIGNVRLDKNNGSYAIKKIISNYLEDNTLEIKFLNEDVETSSGLVYTWLWSFMPYGIQFKYTDENKLSKIIFKYDNDAAVTQLTANEKLNSNDEAQFVLSAIFTLYGMSVLDVPSLSASIENILNNDRLSSAILYEFEFTDTSNNNAVSIIVPRIFKHFDSQCMINKYKYLTDTFQKEGQSYIDFSDLPLQRGVLGRRQRVWKIPNENNNAKIVFMDLKQSNPRFGQEIMALTPEFVTFYSSIESIDFDDTVHRLLNFVHVAKTNIDYNHKVFENNSFLEKDWSWIVDLQVGERSIQGEIVDNVGSYMWLRDAVAGLKRNLEFEWNGEMQNIPYKNANIYLPESVVIHMENRKLKVDFIFNSKLDVNSELTVIDTSLKLYSALLVSGGFLDIINSTYTYKNMDNGITLKTNYNFEQANIRIFSGESILHETTLYDIVPSDYSWARNYDLTNDDKYHFTSDKYIFTETDYYSLFRSGDYGFHGMNSVYPKFSLPPSFGVMTHDKSGRGLDISLSVERTYPFINDVVNYIDYLNRPVLVSTRSVSSSVDEKSIHNSVHQRISDKDRAEVLKHIHEINYAKNRWWMQNNVKPDYIPSWDDLNKYLETPHDTFHRPFENEYQINPLDSSATYGYP